VLFLQVEVLLSGLNNETSRTITFNVSLLAAPVTEGSAPAASAAGTNSDADEVIFDQMSSSRFQSHG